MSLEVWERVLTEAKDYAHTIQFYFQGEPLLNNDLPQMIREAHEAGLYTIVSTNAQALTLELAKALVEAGLSRIIVWTVLRRNRTMRIVLGEVWKRRKLHCTI